MKTTQNLLSCIEIAPKQQAKGSVIWLHGLGADGNDFVPIVPELRLADELGLRFIFPNAEMRPVTINNGYVMRAWYDILAMDITHRADKEGINESVNQINSLIENEESKGIPSQNIILAGFSQGAVMALTAGLRSNKTLAGILALSGYLPFTEDIIGNLSASKKNIPIWMGHGIQDNIVPYQAGLTAFDTLKRSGLTISWHSYQMGHSVCAEEVRDIADWITAVTQK
jgi:phospholipase/carboxylesterase